MKTETAGAPTRARAALLGILAGVAGALAIGELTSLAPSLFPDIGLEWLWIAWPIPPTFGILGGAVIGKFTHHVMSRRAEVAERSLNRAPDLRDV
jgi:hypothetical protein